MEYAPGDKVIVETSGKKIEGILMQGREKDTVVVKLTSGYNVGIKKESIKKIALKEKYKKGAEKQEAMLGHDKSKPTISILHTGGTIASKVDYRTGGVVARFTPEELLKMFPKIKEIANIHSKLIANMFSEDIRFKHYSVMAKAIEEEVKKGVSGIVLTHGTDTMAVTAAALSFILQGINIPVVVVGSQRSSDRGSSDAEVNLVCALQFITKTDFVGVGICMHENSSDENCVILPGTKTRKLHTSRRDAFKAVNAKPIARVEYKTGKVHLLTKGYLKKDAQRKLTVKPDMEEKVGLVKMHPNFMPEQFLVFKGYKGLIIEGTGLGQGPIGVPDKIAEPNKKNFDALKEVIKSGCVVVMTSQCIYGRVHMHVYSTAIDLVEAGVIPGEDMLAETALVKLSWLLGNYPKEKAKDMIGKNFAGEISERTEYEEAFLKE